MSEIYSFPVEEQLKYQQGIPYDCAFFHPGQTCESQLLRMLPLLLAKNAKVYLPVHLIPFIIYKRKILMKQPLSTIGKSLLSYAKSILFLTFMVEILRLNWCKQVRIRKTVDAFIPLTGGFLGGFALLLESNTRAQEIMLSIVPRFFETLVNLIKRKGLIGEIPKGDVIVFAFVLAILHYYYQHDSKAVKSTFRKAFLQFWGKN